MTMPMRNDNITLDSAVQALDAATAVYPGGDDAPRSHWQLHRAFFFPGGQGYRVSVHLNSAYIGLPGVEAVEHEGSTPTVWTWAPERVDALAAVNAAIDRVEALTLLVATTALDRAPQAAA